MKVLGCADRQVIDYNRSLSILRSPRPLRQPGHQYNFDPLRRAPRRLLSHLRPCLPIRSVQPAHQFECSARFPRPSTATTLICFLLLISFYCTIARVSGTQLQHLCMCYVRNIYSRSTKNSPVSRTSAANNSRRHTALLPALGDPLEARPSPSARLHTGHQPGFQVLLT